LKLVKKKNVTNQVKQPKKALRASWSLLDLDYLIIMGFLQLTIVVLAIISLLYLLSFWATSKKGDSEKLSTYETGFNPIRDARKKIDIIFWIIGLLY
jgi:NADH:ubiquinone oxidoreductase subunit 3 (subunit A)